jgi:hypothetical protein
VGAGTGLTNRTLGGSGGGETKVINSANLPTHQHTIDHDHPAPGSGVFNTGTESSDHSHSGVTGFINQNHTHTIGFSGIGVTSGGTIAIVPNSSNPPPFSYASGTVSSNHDHNFSTGGRSAAHSHAADIAAFTGNSGNGGFANNPLDVVNPFLAFNFIIKV